MITLTEREYCRAGWKKIPFKMLWKGQIKAIWFFSSFWKSSPCFLICPFLHLFLYPFSFSFSNVTGDFPHREFSEACQPLNYFSALFLYLPSDLLAALQNIMWHSWFTQERFWEEMINWKMGKTTLSGDTQSKNHSDPSSWTQCYLPHMYLSPMGTWYNFRLSRKPCLGKGSKQSLLLPNRAAC